MTTTARQERSNLRVMTDEFVDRLDFVDAVVLLALVKRAPDQLMRTLAATIVATTEADGLLEECRGM